MASTVRETVLSAGAAFALGSMALVGAQIARPDEVRPVAEARVVPGVAERRIDVLRRQLKLEPAPPPQWERVAEALRANARQELRPALLALYEVMQPHQRRIADRVFRATLKLPPEATPG